MAADGRQGRQASAGAAQAEFLAALSLATDPAIGQPTGVGLRSALVAVFRSATLGDNAETPRDASHHAFLGIVGSTPEIETLIRLFGALIAHRCGVAGADVGPPAEMMPATVRHFAGVFAGWTTLSILRAQRAVRPTPDAEAIVGISRRQSRRAGRAPSCSPWRAAPLLPAADRFPPSQRFREPIAPAGGGRTA